MGKIKQKPSNILSVVHYAYGSISIELRFTINSSYENQSTHMFDGERKCRQFIALLYLHMFSNASIGELSYIDNLTEGCYSDL